MTVESLADLDVSNVYIYVGDAVRNDYLHDQIRTQGISVRTIAASTHSPTSFASLITGKYPPQHGVETFTNRINDQTPTIPDIFDVNTGFINSIFEFADREHAGSKDPIHSVLNWDQSEIPELGSIASPFVLVERGPGGHAPYGDYEGTASQYFLNRSDADTEMLRADYSRSIERDADLFKQRLETLQDRGLLEDTLVIYTSDHGEILGENGTLGHNGPMRPELVYVPTVFIHPELREAQEQNGSIHHIDILPTVSDILKRGEEYVSKMGGRSVLSGVIDEPRPCFWSNTFLPESVPILTGNMDYTGVWDLNGGHVFTKTNIPNRLSVLGGKLIKSSKRSYMRRNLGACLRTYLRGNTTYGSPQFTQGDAEQILAEVSKDSTSSMESTLSDEGRQHLEDLGYLE